MSLSERFRAAIALSWLLATAALSTGRHMWRRVPGTRLVPTRMRFLVDVAIDSPRRVDRAQTRTGAVAGGGAAATAAAAAAIVESQGLVGLVEQYGIGGIVYALSLEIIGGIQSFGTTITAPFRAFGSGLSDLVSAVIPVRIVNAAADFTAFSITRGEWAIFGPATFAVGVGATMAGLWVFTEMIRRADVSVFGAVLDRFR